MGGHSLDRISVQFQNFSGHLPHKSSLRHELNLPPSCTHALPRSPTPAQAETGIFSWLGEQGNKRCGTCFSAPDVWHLWSRGGLGRNRQREVLSGEGLWPGRSQPHVGCPCFFHWLLVRFPSWQCVQMPVSEGSLCWFLGGTSASEELTAHSLLPTRWAQTLAQLHMPLMYDNINRA